MIYPCANDNREKVFSGMDWNTEFTEQ